jgi:hypothetical protein
MAFSFRNAHVRSMKCCQRPSYICASARSRGSRFMAASSDRSISPEVVLGPPDPLPISMSWAAPTSWASVKQFCRSWA